MCQSKAVHISGPICNKTIFMAWVMEDSLDEDVTNLGAGLYPNTRWYVLAMCLSNQANSFLGCQGVSNSSHYILTGSTPASHATSLQTLKYFFPHEFPEEMQFLTTMFPAILKTYSMTTGPVCRMGVPRFMCHVKGTAQGCSCCARWAMQTMGRTAQPPVQTDTRGQAALSLNWKCKLKCLPSAYLQGQLVLHTSVFWVLCRQIFSIIKNKNFKFAYLYIISAFLEVPWRTQSQRSICVYYYM